MSTATMQRVGEEKKMASDPKGIDGKSASVREISLDNHEIDPQWQSLEMLPESYSLRRRARRILYAWSCLLFAMLSVFCGVTASYYLSGQRGRRENAALVLRAAPLLRMQNQISDLKQQNSKIGKWSQLVNSARPDQSLLQTLAAISAATASGENDIEVESVKIKLKLEASENAVPLPSWATPELQVVANVVGRETAEQWVKRINESSRAKGVEMQLSKIGRWVDGKIQLIGEPSATRVLP